MRAGNNGNGRDSGQRGGGGMCSGQGTVVLVVVVVVVRCGRRDRLIALYQPASREW